MGHEKYRNYSRSTVLQELESGPLFSWVDINPTELCNRTCSFCPRGIDYPNQNLHITEEVIEKAKKDDVAFGIPRLFRNTEDRDFAVELMQKTILNDGEYTSEISKKTPNWDKERIAELDAVLMKMAICEFVKFPSIPVKVTINEYLEIAKEYSTPKSSIFINGILDKISKEFKADGKLNKMGRGLM